jgi:hypothetical protein
MMKNHPIENRASWMARAIDSRYIGNEESRNAPGKESRQKSRDSAKKLKEKVPGNAAYFARTLSVIADGYLAV